MPVKSFLEVRIEISGEGSDADLMIARLDGLGFNGFVEEEGAILAYHEISDGGVDIEDMLRKENIPVASIKTIEDKNWNEVWESDYQSVIIGNELMVRAPFHPATDDVKYDIIIEPRMAFGTAHHETTEQMLMLISEMDMHSKRVLDMGCGTAVLAILAYKMGAGDVLAIDNDEWAYRNSLDNVEINAATDIEVQEGDAALLENKEFDIIFANINRNILLKDIPAYASVLAQPGKLLMSGFYTEDLLLIEEKANASGLRLESTCVKNNWVAAIFVTK